jgi:predicted RNA-binding protein with PIN domain
LPYYLDGNNLIGLARGAARPAEGDRHALIQELADRLRATRSSVRLFFDGPSQATTSLGPLTVRQAGGSADEAILREVSAARDPGQITVVTADRELCRRSQEAGARTQTPAQFWARFGTGGTEPSKPDATRVDVDEWIDYFSDPENRGR